MVGPHILRKVVEEKKKKKAKAFLVARASEITPCTLDPNGNRLQTNYVPLDYVGIKYPAGGTIPTQYWICLRECTVTLAEAQTSLLECSLLLGAVYGVEHTTREWYLTLRDLFNLLGCCPNLDLGLGLPKAPIDHQGGQSGRHCTF